MGDRPGTYRGLLARWGLAPSRASELKAVQECSSACRLFLGRHRCLSWKEALSLARRQGPKGRQLAARRLARLLLAHGDFLPVGETSRAVDGFWMRRATDGGLELHDGAGTLTIARRCCSVLLEEASR